jgi:membrane-associated phospholipid phosphatase
MRNVSAIIFALVCASVSVPAIAQTTPDTPAIAQAPGTPAIPQLDKSGSNNGLVSGFALDFLNDQKAIWTSPFHIQGKDVEWLAPTAAGTGVLFIFDHRISDAVKADTSLRSPSNMISNVGLVVPWAVPGSMWALGSISHNAHTAEAGRLGIEAAVDSEVVMQVVKLATNRMRPNGANSQSFPSGHTMSAFAFAAVMANEYHDKPLVVWGSYGLATAVGLARVGSLNHFPSDVVAGAVIGELIGRYVVRHHAVEADSVQ